MITRVLDFIQNDWCWGLVNIQSITHAEVQCRRHVTSQRCFLYNTLYKLNIHTDDSTVST
jgi:hypothetical protein